MNKNLDKVSVEAPSKPSVFTFVPMVQKLPVENSFTEEQRPGAVTKRLSQNFPDSHEEETSGQSMTDRKPSRAEIVFIRDSEEGGAGNTTQPTIKPHLKPDHVTPSQSDASLINTLEHVAAGTTSMETAVDQHWGISPRRCRKTSGLAETHKIKSSYKSLAAIPTNTLLMDQQAIDEQVERDGGSCEPDRRQADTHAEMCSPSQLRQQSEELYAVIDEILASSGPQSKSSQPLQSSRSSTNSTGLQNNSTFPKSLGRETKYASLSSLYPSSSVDRKMIDSKKTKPGVIRPMTAVPRLTLEDEEQFHPNPFKESDVEIRSPANNQVQHKVREEAGRDLNMRSKVQMWRDECDRSTPSSACDLQITEPEDLMHHPVKDASPSFSRTDGRVPTSETHI